VAFVSSDGSSSQTATVSGAGLTWTLARRTNTQPGTAEVWTAFASAKLTGVTVTSTPGAAGYFQSLTVVAFTGAGGIGATAGANATSAAPSVSLTTTKAGSWAFAVGFDYNIVAARTLGPGQTMVHQAVQAGTGTLWVQSTTAPTPAAGTVVTLNDTAPTNARYDFTAVEVLPASASTGGPPVISAVAASAITPTGATISWNTDQPTTAQVEYGTTTAYGSTTPRDSSLTLAHSQGLTGLSAATLYHYRVVSANAAGTSTTSPDAIFTTADPASNGQWSPSTAWPIVAVDSALLSTGDVLAFDDDSAQPITDAKVWRPSTGAFTDVPVAAPIFCSGHAALPDGRLLVAGGGHGETGTTQANIFDPVTNAWTRIADMNLPRWYPSVTGLPNGTYRIRVTANPDHRLHETSSTNNVSYREVVLGGTPARVSSCRKSMVTRWRALPRAVTPSALIVIGDGRPRPVTRMVIAIRAVPLAVVASAALAASTPAALSAPHDVSARAPAIAAIVTRSVSRREDMDPGYMRTRALARGLAKPAGAGVQWRAVWLLEDPRDRPGSR